MPQLTRLSAPAETALLVLFSSFLFMAGNAVVRHNGQELHGLQLVFLRVVFSVLTLLIVLAVTGRLASLRSGRLRLYASRTMTGFFAMSLWFWALTLMPMTEAQSLAFATPLFVTAGAALFLGETVRIRRWTATIIGFIGVLIILRPTAEAITLPAMMVLGSCVFGAASTLQAKSLARTESAIVMVTLVMLFLTPLTAVPAFIVWKTPSWQTLAWMSAMGAGLSLAHVAMAKAFQIADASAITTLEYSKLVFSAAIAYFAFGEVMDRWSWIGAGVIVASTLYITHREAVLARQPEPGRAPPVRAPEARDL